MAEPESEKPSSAQGGGLPSSDHPLNPILQRQIELPEIKINYFSLFRYATVKEYALLLISAFFAAVSGAMFPLLILFIGNLVQVLKDFNLGTIPQEQLSEQIRDIALYIVYLFLGQLVSVFIFTNGCLLVGEAITNAIREKYVRSLFRQNIAFFDTYGSGKITSQLTSSTATIQDAISHKIGLFVSACSCFVASYAIGFVKHWKLTFILTSTVVAITGVMIIMSGFMAKFGANSSGALAEASAKLEETFSGIRVVKALGLEKRLSDELDPQLLNIEFWGKRVRHVMGWMLAIMYGLIFLNYGLAIWQGYRFMQGGTEDVGAIITVLMCLNIGAFLFGNVGPHLQAMSLGAAAAQDIFAVIERESVTDGGAPPGSFEVEGNIEFRNVSHVYPSRPDTHVLQDFSMIFPAGKVTAIVGASGSGKSTIVSILERFYEPVSGQVFLDGHDITHLNVQWLRQQFGLVGQEPVLFNGSIFKNVAYGLKGTQYGQESREVTMKLVTEACRIANAHDFITALPHGYDQEVGIRGASLSGGQRQRIAIARAIVSGPKILLLDEATSALDVQSEEAVQLGLNMASSGRTTIVVAHSLSTIKLADNIIVMEKGRVAQQGTHAELEAQEGLYQTFVRRQQLKQATLEPPHARITPAVDTPASPQHRLSEKTGSIYGQGESEAADKSPSTKYSFVQLVKFVARFNKEDWRLMVTGIASAVISGAVWPAHSVFFAKAIVALSSPSPASLARGPNFWAAMYVMLAFVQIASQGVQGSAFAICAERLILRARRVAFKYLLRQDVEFFDDPLHSSGIMTSFVSSDVNALAGLSGVFLGTLFSATATVLGGLILSLAVGWKLTLVTMGTIPIIIVAGYLRLKLVGTLEKISRKVHEESAGRVCEEINAVRTVAASCLEDEMCEDYVRSLKSKEKTYLRATLWSSGWYALSEAVPLGCMSLGFWYGATLVMRTEYTTEQFFIVVTAVIFGASSAGLVFAFAPDFGKAGVSAERLQELVDRQPEVDTWSEEGDHIETTNGKVDVSNVVFYYNQRSKTPVLNSISLGAAPGQSIGLCGGSGSGKSTVASLLERFYNPSSGTVSLDEKDVRTININSYRAQFALVNQEPLLFSCSIRENLLYGSLGKDLTDSEIEEACKMAQVYDFVCSLPEGLDTSFGSNAVMLSGGQRQRLSIARAILRKPRVLILDEATSALDSTSERAVIEALTKTAEGRTTIMVAHRLSTIQGCDKIFYLRAGAVAEEGTHEELMAKRGSYYDSVNLQSLG
ncbi:hypothetical protein IAQ61_007457 [Plenodomus lingam]|nr:hypothetical protein IAQ61_007457 [Plenodomus lingam]